MVSSKINFCIFSNLETWLVQGSVDTCLVGLLELFNTFWICLLIILLAAAPVCLMSLNFKCCFTTLETRSLKGCKIEVFKNGYENIEHKYFSLIYGK